MKNILTEATKALRSKYPTMTISLNSYTGTATEYILIQPVSSAPDFESDDEFEALVNQIKIGHWSKTYDINKRIEMMDTMINAGFNFIEAEDEFGENGTIGVVSTYEFINWRDEA